MADSVVAIWDGHDYQARYFWIHASGLRDKEKPFIVEVSYEADGPKGFDDVVVRYNPGRKGRRSFAVEVAHHQVKFHVNQSGRFGYADLVEPEFIGATKFSILHRLKEAVAKAPLNSTFTLVTTDRIRDDDPLSELISSRDKSIDVDRLREGKTDASRMGQVRKLWREHLELNSDDELFAIVDAFHIADGNQTLEQMREEVDRSFKVVGLKGGDNTWAFKFDGTARALKAVGKNTFNRDDFDKFCVDQDWIRANPEDDRQNVSIRSFGDGPTDYLLAAPDYELSLLDRFDARQLRAGGDWTAAIQPEIERFLTRIRQTKKNIRLYLEAHASIAFLAGSLLGMKSGTGVELVQKGRGPTTVWRSDDGKVGDQMSVTSIETGKGADVAVVVSLARNALRDVEEHVREHSGEIGRILHFIPTSGHGPAAVAGGAHAAASADQVADAVSDLGLRTPARVHLFIAGPNGFTFFLGQHREAMGPVVTYEFDFGGTRTYHPSFRIG